MTAGSDTADATSSLPYQQAAAQPTAHRWTEPAGAHLLVVDPDVDDGLASDLSARGIHVTAVDSTIDALVEFGRTNPSVIVIAPHPLGIPATDFLATIQQYASPFVVAALDSADQPEAGRLLCAGAKAAVIRPYTGAMVWDVLQRADRPLHAQARVAFGPIELDARAYTVRVREERLPDLPRKEFELLRVLMHRAPDVLDNDELRRALWGEELPTDNTIAVHVGRLRHRLEGVATIRRVRGRGYSLTLA